MGRGRGLFSIGYQASLTGWSFGRHLRVSGEGIARANVLGQQLVQQVREEQGGQQVRVGRGWLKGSVDLGSEVWGFLLKASLQKLGRARLSSWPDPWLWWRIWLACRCRDPLLAGAVEQGGGTRDQGQALLVFVL